MIVFSQLLFIDTDKYDSYSLYFNTNVDVPATYLKCVRNQGVDLFLIDSNPDNFKTILKYFRAAHEDGKNYFDWELIKKVGE